jgi:hypothetical protein
LADAVNVGVLAKNSGDYRQALNRFGIDDLQFRSSIQAVLDGARDQRFDFLGRQARGLGLNNDARWREFREDVNLGAAGDVDTVNGDQTGEDHDYAAIAKGTCDHPFQQVRGPSYEGLEVMRYPGLAPCVGNQFTEQRDP